jgi:uncharacterized membrane protein
MIDQWGTEIAIAIAVVTGSFVLWVGRKEFSKSRTGQVFTFVLVSCLLLVMAMYFGLRLEGVNP